MQIKMSILGRKKIYVTYKIEEIKQKRFKKYLVLAVIKIGSKSQVTIPSDSKTESDCP